jgi:hypothetical protein
MTETSRQETVVRDQESGVRSHDSPSPSYLKRGDLFDFAGIRGHHNPYSYSGLHCC